MVTSDRVVGRPRTGCVARPFYCERMHPRLVNAILTNICSIVTNTILAQRSQAALSGFARRVCVFKMSRIGGSIRDTIATGNDAPRVSVRKRGRPSFLVLLNARASNPGHSYLRLLRRKCLLPSAPRVRLRTLNRTSYESRNAMTNVPASDDGAWLRYPEKNGADSSAESAPKREWQSKNVDRREKCPQVSWPSHPTCQRDG